MRVPIQTEIPAFDTAAHVNLLDLSRAIHVDGGAAARFTIVASGSELGNHRIRAVPFDAAAEAQLAEPFGFKVEKHVTIPLQPDVDIVDVHLAVAADKAAAAVAMIIERTALTTGPHGSHGGLGDGIPEAALVILMRVPIEAEGVSIDASTHVYVGDLAAIDVDCGTTPCVAVTPRRSELRNDRIAGPALHSAAEHEAPEPFDFELQDHVAIGFEPDIHITDNQVPALAGKAAAAITVKGKGAASGAGPSSGRRGRRRGRGDIAPIALSTIPSDFECVLARTRLLVINANHSGLTVARRAQQLLASAPPYCAKPEIRWVARQAPRALKAMPFSRTALQSSDEPIVAAQLNFHHVVDFQLDVTLSGTETLAANIRTTRVWTILRERNTTGNKPEYQQFAELHTTPQADRISQRGPAASKILCAKIQRKRRTNVKQRAGREPGT